MLLEDFSSYSRFYTNSFYVFSCTLPVFLVRLISPIASFIITYKNKTLFEYEREKTCLSLLCYMKINVSVINIDSILIFLLPLQGSASFILGLFFLFVRWPVVGIILEIYGCIVLFGLVSILNINVLIDFTLAFPKL